MEQETTHRRQGRYGRGRHRNLRRPDAAGDILPIDVNALFTVFMAQLHLQAAQQGLDLVRPGRVRAAVQHETAHRAVECPGIHI